MKKYKKHSKKIAVGLILMLVIISVASYSIYHYIKTPKLTKEIKTNVVYLGWYDDEYPPEDEPRYYIKLNDDKSFVWIYDDSRRKQKNYNREEGKYPYINIWIGKYTVKDGNYILKFTDIAEVTFEDVRDVKCKKICQYKAGIYDSQAWLKRNKEYKEDTMVIFHLDNGTYVLGVPTPDGKYNKERVICALYDKDKSDIKKLPDTLEEFRNQYTMDEGAHQRYLNDGMYDN